MENYLDCQKFELSEEQKDLLWDIFIANEDYQNLSSLMTAILRHKYYRLTGTILV